MASRHFQRAVVATCFALSGLNAVGGAEIAHDVGALTGAHTRAVWVQDQSPSNGDTLALGRELKLMGFDSQDGRGERAILNDIQNYAKPLLTPDGKRVVYSDRYSKDVFVVNWDGSGKRRLGAGYAVEVWADPKAGTTWVYAATQVGKLNSINFKSLRRIPLDGGGRWELIWDKTEISPDNFQLSADGTMAAGEFPWPNGGSADLTARTWRKRADGCWASLAPDNSYLAWVFDGPHRNIYLYPRESLSSWKISLNMAPGMEGFEVFHPRWSNHVRYFAMTGPYKLKTSVNTIAGGGPDVEVYIGRFSDDFRKVDAWGRVTNNNRGDFHPDVWISGGEKFSIPATLLEQVPLAPGEADQWPGNSSGLVFVWDNAESQNQVPTQDQSAPRLCRVEARGRAKYNRYFDMDCSGGSFVAEKIGGELRTACQATGELTLEAAITPGRSDQTGPARIITFSSNALARNFMLGQDHDTLIFDLQTKREQRGGTTLRLGKLSAGTIQHVLLTYSPGALACYLDGKPVPVGADLQGDFGGWGEHQLVFGDEYTGKFNWAGRLEAIAIYNRTVTAEEAARQFELFAARLSDRQPAERLRVRAKCLETTPIPDPRTIVPYRRALVINRYQVEKVLQGELNGREILVAQWGILDKTVVPDAKVRVGQNVDLTLEKLDDHPELKGERQIVDVERLDLPWFYGMSR
jgi:hypothetical protein